MYKFGLGGNNFDKECSWCWWVPCNILNSVSLFLHIILSVIKGTLPINTIDSMFSQ